MTKAVTVAEILKAMATAEERFRSLAYGETRVYVTLNQLVALARWALFEDGMSRDDIERTMGPLPEGWDR